MGRGPKPTKGKAKPAVSRKSPKNEGSKVRDLEKRLAEALRDKAEALEQQTATAEILRIIGSSPADAQPVFDAIAVNAVRLCDAKGAVVVRYDGALLHVAAHHNVNPEGVERFERQFPRAPDRHFLMGRAVLDGTVVHVPDLQAAEEFSESVGRQSGVGSNISIPLLRQGRAIGAIGIARQKRGPFSDAQIELLKVFADQAVIAIENVRLFNETKEALEQQTATSEILRVIASSPTDIQPVFDAVAESAARLCEADSTIFHREGERLRLVAHHGPITPAGKIGEFTIPAAHGHYNGRCVLEGRIIHVADAQAETDEFPEGSVLAQKMRLRGVLNVPLMREGVAIGTISLRRSEARLFTDRQVALLQTFADQAVIAIENVRLFNETKEALERQTATSEILRVISESPTDVRPVFEVIAAHACRLCDGVFANVIRFDGTLMHNMAENGFTAEAREVLRRAFPSPPSRSSMSGRAILAATVVYVEDVTHDMEPGVSRELGGRTGHRAMVSVPMLHNGAPVGAITVARLAAGRFAERQVNLLKTFADQAVIAIENVRLFTELETRNAELREALDHQTATAEVLAVISRSPTDVQPVFAAIARSAAGLCEAELSAVYRYDGELIHVAANTLRSSEQRDAFARLYPMPPGRGTPVARAILERRTQHVPDTSDDPEYLALLVSTGFRSALAVPMVREGAPIGAIAVGRMKVREFTAAQIQLLETFADQAAIAIENVRLFKELQSSNTELRVALEQQTATSELLKVIGRSTFDLQPVFETLAENAVRLCEAEQAAIFRFDGQVLRAVVTRNLTPENQQFLERHPIAPGRESGAGRAVLERRTVHIHDVRSDPEYAYGSGQLPFRSLLSMPMLRGDELLGAISIQRDEVRPFTDSQIALMETFADQAAIAIENARLLSELQARTQDLTRSVAELKALGEVSHALSSTLDVDIVLDTIATRANDLVGADGCTIFEYDEAAEQFHLRATRNLEPRLVELARGTPLRRGDQGILGRLPSERQAIQVPDITLGSYSSPISDALIEAGYRAVVAVPLVQEDHLIGALTMNRKTPGGFPPETIELLQTFATQSALAIQNARLFREIEDKSRQLEVASQHKSEFLANMSHELRTPLNAIIGFSEVLAEKMFGELNEKQEEYLKDIYASGNHLLSLINDILDLSKIEAGRMELELSDFHLPTALDSALTLVRERAGRRGIALQMNVDNRLGQIQADERKVRQVVLNLLSNAIKFTPEGGRIEVRAAPRDGFVEVSVSDTGVGIAPEDQEAVFEEFRQVGTADKKVEGTGLGLTLCRKFVELHGGRIWVKSQAGAGSKFTFTIPVRYGK
jgi:GAF domain-containing protein